MRERSGQTGAGTRLYAAAGGGGDAIAAAMLHRATRPRESTAHIATYSWDRLIVDPIPGPRDPSWFEGLEAVGERNFLVKPSTSVRPPAGSTLPRLAAELPEVRLYLLDPRGGARGMHDQLDELTRILAAERVIVVDVGGDILANGHEPTLRSPLADALVLAAATDLPVAVDVVVMGTGLDGELPQAEVVERCRTAARETFRLSPADAEPFGRLFEWHPSEATGLLWAAIMGARGVAELRDGPCRVELRDESLDAHVLDVDQALGVNDIAQAISESASLDEATSVLQAQGIPSEIDYERRKAGGQRVRGEDSSPQETLKALLDQATAEAEAGGADFVTTRRLAEEVAPGTRVEDLHVAVARLGDVRYRPPLWLVHLERWRRVEL